MLEQVKKGPGAVSKLPFQEHLVCPVSQENVTSLCLSVCVWCHLYVVMCARLRICICVIVCIDFVVFVILYVFESACVSCDHLHLHMYIWSFPGGSEDKASACNAGDPGSILGLRRSPGEGNGTPLQYSCLENPMDRGAWRATVHGVAKSQT